MIRLPFFFSGTRIRCFSIVVSASFFLASRLPAILDGENANGMSDVWERRFNQGALMPDTFLRENDADGDGWSNLMEAVLGTDPFNPTAPEGCFRMAINQSPAVYAPDGQGDGELLTPSSILLSWPGTFGKKYTLLYSSDLSAGSWRNVEAPFIGNGSTVQYGFPLTPGGADFAARLFWKVAVEDSDSDENGTSDAEAHLLALDADQDGVPDEFERCTACHLFADYGIIAPRSPELFDVNLDYGGLGTTAASLYHGLENPWEIPAVTLMATPSIEGLVKSVEQSKAGFLSFTQLPAPSAFVETGPVLDYHRTKTSKLESTWSQEWMYSSMYFRWDEDSCTKITTEEYVPTNGGAWTSSTSGGIPNVSKDHWIWQRSPQSTTWANTEWLVNDHASYSDHDYVGIESESPLEFTFTLYGPASPGTWTSTTATKRIGEAAYHSAGQQAVKPNPGIGYIPDYKLSETYHYTQELSNPYTTGNLVQDATTRLGTIPEAGQVPVGFRDLVENERKITLKKSKYRLAWMVPAQAPVEPGNTLVKTRFLWREIHDPESSTPGAGRKTSWKSEDVSAAPGTLAHTAWHEIPVPEQDGTTWVRAVNTHGSIAFPAALLVNRDDDDGDGNPDRSQAALVPATDNDLIPLSFAANAPAVDEQALVFRLGSSGAGKFRLWKIMPGQSPQIVTLPYKLEPHDYNGATGLRPSYFIEAVAPGTVALHLDAEALGAKLARIAEAEFKCLDLSIDFAAGMRGQIGDLVASNKPTGGATHFVTVKSGAEGENVVLTVSGVGADEIGPNQPDQLVEWVGATPATDPLRGNVPRSQTGKFPVTLRVIATGQSIPATNVWVTWANLGTEYNTPTMMEATNYKNADDIPVNHFRGKISWRYVCEPREMFDLSVDVPDLSGAPLVPPPGGTHAWLGTPLSNGAALRYDASRQVRVVSRCSDANLHQIFQSRGPDILAYPQNPVEGNDDPSMNGELVPYLPNGITGIMLDSDFPDLVLPVPLSSATENDTVLKLAQFRQFARVQIGDKWYKCSDYGLSELNIKVKRIDGKWVDDGSTFSSGNNSQFPPP